jgi:hypoxanthine phosphoribosyltransferase
MKISAEEAQRVLRESELLHDASAVEAALSRMAAEITAKLGDRRPVVLCVMVGGLIPAGLLLPKLDFPLEIDYCHATRYRGATTGGDLLWIARPQIDLTDREVLIVDDILDEGHTLAQIIEDCRFQGARGVYTAALVNKRHNRRFNGLKADFVGLDVEDRYVFGAGMDYKGWFRNLPGIYAAPET